MGISGTQSPVMAQNSEWPRIDHLGRGRRRRDVGDETPTWLLCGGRNHSPSEKREAEKSGGSLGNADSFLREQASCERLSHPALQSEGT